MPRRVQLQRRRGWRMPANTVKVDRSTRWGNPFRIGAGMSREESIARFRAWISAAERVDVRAAVRTELRGRNLACWCPLDQPCHADVLLDIAARPDDAP
jgi:hypothetical protein